MNDDTTNETGETEMDFFQYAKGSIEISLMTAAKREVRKGLTHMGTCQKIGFFNSGTPANEIEEWISRYSDKNTVAVHCEPWPQVIGDKTWRRQIRSVIK